MAEGGKVTRLRQVRPEDGDEASRANWRRIYIATAVALLVIEGLLVFYGKSLIAPLVLLVLVFVFARRGEKLRFVRDFGPFVFVLMVYYSMWGAADDWGGSIQVTPQIDAERFLFFGHLPTVLMQDAWYDPNGAHWYDYLAVGAHISHFILPIFFAAVVWQHYRHLHVRFMSTFVLLSYAGFLTFMLMPSAPPWWAAEQGYIESVELVHRTVPGLSRIYSELSPNPVAAIPSLHAAFPLLIFLFSLEIWGRRAWPLALYPLCIWWAIVYSGHHYFVDAIAGAAYAGAAYYALSGHPYALARRGALALWERRPWATIEPTHARDGRRAA